MDNKIRLKFIFFLFISVFVCFLSINNVYAEDELNICTPSALEEKYNAEISDISEVSGGYSVTVSLSRPEIYSTWKKIKDVRFNVKINGYNTGQQVSFDSDWTGYVGSLTEIDDGVDGVEVVLTTDPATPDPDCGEYAKIVLQRDSSPSVDDQLEIGTEQIKDFKVSSEGLNCAGGKSDAELAKTADGRICLAKKYASNKGEASDKYGDLKKFKCDIMQFKKDSELVGENYYTNKKYLYGSKVSKETKSYTYHYFPSDGSGVDTTKATKSYSASCEVKCEEGVSVEYGPPIASKAGLCFDYKVRVTSDVHCSIISKPPPPSAGRVCTPRPSCVHKAYSGEDTQAGPNEDYDKCIKKCDGGKYSKKCSKSCYKKVYGSSKSMKTTDFYNDYTTTKLSSLSSCMKNPQNAHGCYVKDKDGKIRWISDGGTYKVPGNSTSTKKIKKTFGAHTSSYPGRYYSMANWAGKKDSGLIPLYTVPTNKNDGFMRARAWEPGNKACQADCQWKGCEGDVYLNFGDAASDYNANVKVYNELMAKCEAASTCSTETAEFTISVDYVDGNKQTKRVNFPYSSKSDIESISSSSANFSGKSFDELTGKGDKTNEPLNTASKNNTTIIEHDACYAKGDGKNRYVGAWSFPGSWLSLKTGEVTYLSNNDDKWQKQTRRFCLPLDARDVNATWWRAYYNETIMKDSNRTSENTSIKSNEYIDKCGSFSTTTTNDVKESDITYNIHALTKGFGYLGWNIGVDCFYGLGSNSMTSTSKSTAKECTTNGNGNTRVRTVNLTDLFPSTSGAASKGTTTANRTTGFNWSKYATISSKKLAGNVSGSNTSSSSSSASTLSGINFENFVSNPVSYLAKVQEIGYNVYSDRYLDYEFDLSVKDIRDIKSRHRGSSTGEGKGNYTTYTGEFKTGKNSGLSRYRSDLIHDGSFSKKVPTSEEALDCNNMQNYYSGECEKSD